MIQTGFVVMMWIDEEAAVFFSPSDSVMKPPRSPGRATQHTVNSGACGLPNCLAMELPNHPGGKWHMLWLA